MARARRVIRTVDRGAAGVSSCSGGIGTTVLVYGGVLRRCHSLLFTNEWWYRYVPSPAPPQEESAVSFVLPDPGPPNHEFAEPADPDRLERTVEALRGRGFHAHVAADGAAARQFVLDAVPEGAEVHTALSETLTELGIRAEIEESGRYDSV